MKLTAEQIKTECELHRDRIKAHTERLEEVQDNCPHENTFEGLYSWRVGCIDPAIICSDCGKMIKIKGEADTFSQMNDGKEKNL
jgi:hypothetical protein